jgi:rhodanese-related sulfurtransferase
VSSKKPLEKKRGLSRWEKAAIPFIILIVAWVAYSAMHPSVSIQPQTMASTSIQSASQQFAYKTISVSDANAMIQSSPNLLVVDVRTSQEYAQGHLKGAMNIPLSDLPVQIGGLDRNRPILVYCQTGVRSAQAATMLVNAGFTQVYDMEGGLTAWINAGYPTVTSGDTSLVWSAQRPNSHSSFVHYLIASIK